jgi:hypothetical protein
VWVDECEIGHGFHLIASIFHVNCDRRAFAGREGEIIGKEACEKQSR